MKNLEQLNEELQEVLGALRSGKKMDIDLERARETRKQIAELKLKESLKSINSEQRKKREVLVDLLVCEPIEKDMITNSNEINKTKLSNYPKLNRFVKKYPHARFFYHSRGLAVNLGGYVIGCKKAAYNIDVNRYGFEDFTDLKDACKYNGIKFKDITVNDVKKAIAAAKKIELQIKKLKDLKTSISKKHDFYFLSVNGILSEKVERMTLYYK